MKKLMFAATLAAVAMTSFGDVQSANCVGYYTVKVQASKMDLAGCAFVNVGGGDVDVQSITLTDTTDGGTLLMFYDVTKGKYDTLSYYGELYTDDSYSDDPPLPAGWGDNYIKVNKTINPGQGFWIKSDNANDVTIPGQVVAANDNYVDVQASKMDLCANVFPVATDVQTITLSDTTDGGTLLMFYDLVKGKYETLSYYGELYTDDSYSDYPPLPAGWGDNYIKVNKTINPGQGFWIKSDSNNRVSFKSPL